MQYKRILTASVIAISLAIISTTFSSPTMPFYQQEVYASHPQACKAGSTAPHIGGQPAGPCISNEELQEACDQGALFDECKSLEPPLPLNERYPNQGTCIDAGENKDACKAAFKADKPKTSE
jgi:hypothetical protein